MVPVLSLTQLPRVHSLLAEWGTCSGQCCNMYIVRYYCPALPPCPGAAPVLQLLVLLCPSGLRFHKASGAPVISLPLADLAPSLRPALPESALHPSPSNASATDGRTNSASTTNRNTNTNDSTTSDSTTAAQGGSAAATTGAEQGAPEGAPVVHHAHVKDPRGAPCLCYGGSVSGGGMGMAVLAGGAPADSRDGPQAAVVRVRVVPWEERLAALQVRGETCAFWVETQAT